MATMYYNEIIGDVTNSLGSRVIDDMDIRECYETSRPVRITKFGRLFYVGIPKITIGLCSVTVMVIVFENIFEVRDFLDMVSNHALIKCSHTTYKLHGGLDKNDLFMLRGYVPMKEINRMITPKAQVVF